MFCSGLPLIGESYEDFKHRNPNNGKLVKMLKCFLSVVYYYGPIISIHK